MWNMQARPLPASPTSQPIAPASPPGRKRPSPKFSSVLVVPRKPILWLSPASVTSLRSPTEPSSASSFLGTRNSEMPFVPGTSFPSGPVIFASTRWTMFSVSSCSPPEIHILLPKRR